MINKLLKLINKKNCVILVCIVVPLLLLMFLSFSKPKDKSFIDGNVHSEVSNSIGETATLSKFLTYNLYNDEPIYAYLDTSNNTVFVNSDNYVLYKTKDLVDYFRVVGEFEYIYSTSYMDSETNRLINELKYVNTKTNETQVIFKGKKITFELTKDCLYLLDVNNKSLKIYSSKSPSSKSDFKNIKLNKKYDKIHCNKGLVFLSSTAVDNGNIVSYISSVNSSGDIIDICTTSGKIKDITVDYSNDNLIYYTTEIIDKDTNTPTVSVKSRFVIDLSANETQEKIYPELNGMIISLRDKNLCVDSTTNNLMLLNSNMRKIKSVGKLYSNTLYGLLKETSDFSSLFYFNNSGTLSSIQ